MSAYYIYQDQKRCIGCHACEVHCKTKNNVPIGLKFCRITSIGPEMAAGIPTMQFIFLPCLHCEVPQCVSSCPTGAMQKGIEDGIVFVEQSLCIGCESCITACPWGIPQLNYEIEKAIKCDYCKDRVDKGLKPACVTKCTAHSLQWISGEEASLKRETFSKQIDKFKT